MILWLATHVSEGQTQGIGYQSTLCDGACSDTSYAFSLWEFKYGKKNGKGKEYSYNGILVFEGEYLNGQRHGKGKEYYQYKRAPGLCGSYFCNGDEEGKLIFEGEYKNGKIWNGKGYGKDFEGEYKNGERWNGYGREYVRHLMGCTRFEYKLNWSGKYVNGIKIGYPEN